MTRASERPTSWWLGALRRRASDVSEEPELSIPIEWSTETERRAALKFFNAAYRAEESGLRQAHELAGEVRSWDPDLAEVLELYGNEEGWHRELLTEFLARIGGSIEPMGKVTRTLYRIYGRAKRMESIVLTNLMFETIGATTYRLALANVSHPAARRMLAILTRDESFHVPLNVHFLREVLARKSKLDRVRLLFVYYLVYASLCALPLASRPKAALFDHIPVRTLSRAYARELASVFASAPDLGLVPPWPVLRLFGIRSDEVRRESTTSAAAAEHAAERSRVVVTALDG